MDSKAIQGILGQQFLKSDTKRGEQSHSPFSFSLEGKQMNDFERATIYAAYKELERILEVSNDNGKEGDIPPGASFDVSEQTLSITIPKGTIVSRAAGEKGDGIRPTAPTTNFYGWSPLVLMMIFLDKFNQLNAVVRNNLIQAITEALLCGTTTEEKLLERNPHLKKDVKEMKKEILAQLPDRMEPTRRTIKRESKLYPIITFFKKVA